MVKPSKGETPSSVLRWWKTGRDWVSSLLSLNWAAAVRKPLSLKRGASSGAPASTSSDALVKVWVKRMDVEGAQYSAVKGVNLEMSVDDFKARWVAQAKLDVEPSLVTLRLVGCGVRMPAADKEEKAAALDDPGLSLAESGVTGTAWLLAYINVSGAVSTAAGVSSQPAPAALDAFARELQNATVGTDRFLRLTNGTFFLGNPTLGSDLYVRPDVYDALFDKFYQLKQDGMLRIVLTGTPGIGKSRFLLYLLWRLARLTDPACVVFERQVGPILMDVACLRFQGASKVQIGSPSTFLSDLGDPDTWYLVDGHGCRSAEIVTAGLRAFTALAVSPNPSFYKEFMKEPRAMKLYMPKWDMFEIEALGDALQPKTGPREITQQLYRLFGGVPRLVLERAWDMGHAIVELKAAARSMNVTYLDRLGGEGDINDRSKVMHICVPELPFQSAMPELSFDDGLVRQDGWRRRRFDFTKFSIVFASCFVKDAVFRHLLDMERAALKSFLRGGAKGPLKGAMFETLARNVLSEEGGSFPLQWLKSAPSFSTPVKSALNVDGWAVSTEHNGLTILLSKPSQVIENHSLVHLMPKSYFFSNNPNFPTIDGVLFLPTVTIFLQYTITEDRCFDVKDGDNLHKYLNCLGRPLKSESSTTPVLFLYGVPDDVYDRFKLQIPSNLEKKGAKTDDAGKTEDETERGGFRRLFDTLPKVSFGKIKFTINNID